MSAPRQALNLDRPLGRQGVLRAVDMGLKRHALFSDLAQTGKGHNLKTTGIGQYRPVPANEIMQSAQSGNPFRPRPQHQVIGVSQNDVGAERTHLVHIHRLDAAGRADRHKSGRADGAARHIDTAAPGRTIRGLERKGEFGCVLGAHGHAWSAFISRLESP